MHQLIRRVKEAAKLCLNKGLEAKMKQEVRNILGRLELQRGMIRKIRNLARFNHLSNRGNELRKDIFLENL